MKVGDWVFGETAEKHFVKGFIVKKIFDSIIICITESDSKEDVGTRRAVYNPYPAPNIFEGDDVDPSLMVELSLILKDKEMFMEWSVRYAKEKAAEANERSEEISRSEHL